MRERRWFCSACEHTFKVDEDLVFTYPDGMEFVICPICSLNAFVPCVQVAVQPCEEFIDVPIL